MSLDLHEAPAVPRGTPATVQFSVAAPIVPVRSISASIDFYTRVLGFEILRSNDNGSAALIARGPVRLMLIRVAQRKALEATREHLSAYIWVSDVAALWAECEKALSGLPSWRVRPPRRQPYGALEFNVKDPDGFLLFFAEDPMQDANDPDVRQDAGAVRPN
ncbi:MAG: VOC family protein [Pseudomonadota bacterium]